MTAIKRGQLALGAAAWLGGMSLAWSVSAATPAGAPTAADFSRCAGCHSTQAGHKTTRSARHWPAWLAEAAARCPDTIIPTR